MMIRKRTDDGFMNPQYEKWELRFGLIALFMLLATLVVLIGTCLF